MRDKGFKSKIGHVLYLASVFFCSTFRARVCDVFVKHSTLLDV